MIRDHSLGRLWGAIGSLIPLVLLALVSYFRLEIIGGINSLAGVPSSNVGWAAFLVYWLLRIALFGAFLFCFARTVPRSAVQESAPTDSVWMSSIDRRDSLLGVRSLAFLMVFLGHWFLVIAPPADLVREVTGGKPIWMIGPSPHCGVWVFFTLSGYLMGKGFFSGRYEQSMQGIRRFYRNRLLRILPIYVVSVVVTGVIFVPGMFEIWRPAVAFNVMAVATFDQQGGGIPIGALWSVSTEMQFYALVPFFCILMNILLANVRTSLLVGSLAAIALASVILKHHFVQIGGVEFWQQFIYFPLLANLDGFSIGLIVAFIVNRLQRDSRFITFGFYNGLALVMILFLVTSYWSTHAMIGATRNAGDWFLGAGPAVTSTLTACAIYLFEMDATSEYSNRYLVKVGWSVATKLGLWTYALYVCHEPILGVVRKIAPASLTLSESALYFLLAGPLVIALGWLLYKFVELPFDRMKLRGTTDSPLH